MATEAKALVPAAPADDASARDYEALLEALSASARGRAFLAEFARRNRNADTERLLAAIERLELRIAARLPVEPAARSEAERMEGLRARLAVVPPSDEPELPIPAPAALRPVMTLAHDEKAAERPAPILPPAPAAEPARRASPLAALLALTEEERLALFT